MTGILNKKWAKSGQKVDKKWTKSGQKVGICPLLFRAKARKSRAVDRSTIQFWKQYINIKFPLNKHSENAWVCVCY